MQLATQADGQLALPERMVARVFTRLRSRLGNKMADLYEGIDPAKVRAEWSTSLADMTPEELARGVNATRNAVFAPTLGEFRRMCRPALDPEVAWHEAQTGLQARDRGEVGEWSHPAVWRAAASMAWEVKTGTWRNSRARWTAALNKEFEQGWGEPVPPVPQKIEHRPTRRTMPDDVRERMASLGYRMKGNNK
jgi:hypothetical protein